MSHISGGTGAFWATLPTVPRSQCEQGGGQVERKARSSRWARGKEWWQAAMLAGQLVVAGVRQPCGA